MWPPPITHVATAATMTTTAAVAATTTTVAANKAVGVMSPSVNAEHHASLNRLRVIARSFAFWRLTLSSGTSHTAGGPISPLPLFYAIVPP